VNGQRDDLSRQFAVVHAAEHDLRAALGGVEREAKVARRTASRASQPDLGDLYAAVNQIRRAEEALDLARLDLHTASGGDA
jgi:multidrug resistance efflux pump